MEALEGRFFRTAVRHGDCLFPIVTIRKVIPHKIVDGEALECIVARAVRAERIDGVARALGGDLGLLIPAPAPTDPERHCRTVLWSDARATAVLIAWLPGQFSDIHDHDGVECVFRVIQGVALERRYSLNREGIARLTSEDRYLPGSVVVSGDDDIHALGNDAASNETLITLHVYRPEARMRVYRAAPGDST